MSEKIKRISKKLGEAIAWNDADYTVKPTVNGKQVVCPYYLVWSDMLKRVYSRKYQAKRPTYIGVTVCAEWKVFSQFRAWMEQQDWEGKELDKDLLHPLNRVYKPESCCFVSQHINGLMNDRGAARGSLPQGVYWHKVSQKYTAQCSDVTGKQKHLGQFDTVAEARAAYVSYKQQVIQEVAETVTDNDALKRGLLFWCLLI